MLLRQWRTMRVVGALHLKQIAVDGFILFTVIIQPLIVAALALYMLRDKAGFEAIYVVVGSGLTGLWSGTLFFSAFNVESERWTGTLEEIVASPTSLQTVVAGKSLANTALSLTSMIFSYVVVALAFGFKLTITNPIAFVVSLLLGAGSMIAMGLVIAAFMSLIVGASVWANALEFPMYILGGFLFPIALLPDWVTPLSYLLAPYWAARALHGTTSGTSPWGDLLLNWGLLILLSAVYLLVSRRLFEKLLYRARVEATLGLQ